MRHFAVSKIVRELMNNVTGVRNSSGSLMYPVSAPSQPSRSTLVAETNGSLSFHRSQTSQKHRRLCGSSNKSSVDHDIPPLMCHPLQSSRRCISVEKAYRAKSKSGLAVSADRIGIQPCFCSSLLETFERLCSPPTSASACLSSLATV
ncbi:hypothetical protein M3J09_004349 [Ascochyta lentis]